MDISRSHSQPRSAKQRAPQLPSYQRAAHPPSLHLIERDRQILLRLWYYRLLTTHQIEALLFHTVGQARTLKTQCQRRLQLLFHHHYLERIQLPVILGEGRKPFLYALASRGVQELVTYFEIRQSDIGWKSRHNQIKDPYHLAHTLANNDLWVILDRLAQSDTLALPYWMTQRHLQSRHIKAKLPHLEVNGKVHYKMPDSYFALQLQGYSDLAHCFYEEDRGTQTQEQWLNKVRAYIAYQQDGLSQIHFGFRNFRVLTKTTTAKRLANLKQWTENAGGDALFWFTTCDRVSIWRPTTLLEPIWQVASTIGEYPLTVTDATLLCPQSA